MSEHHDDRGTVVNFLAGLGLGALLGATAALLFAPKSGSDTREDIANLAEEAKLKAGRMAGDISESSEELLRKSKELLETTKERVQSAIDAGKQATVKKLDEVTHKSDNEEA